VYSGGVRSDARRCRLVPYSGTMKQPQKHRTRVRLSIDLEPQVYERLRVCADKSRMGLGRFIGDWMGDSIDAAESVAATVERAHAAPATAARHLHSVALGLSTATWDLLERAGVGDGTAGAAAAKHAPAGSAAGGSASPVTPRSVIRGETSRRRGPK
jgi:hypothetical protein